jgi:hypothetical protein
MYARALDEAANRLRELRHEGWEDLALASFALVLSLAATQVRPALAIPLFLGGLGVGALGARALWRRWDLLDRLAGECDAYEIADVLAHASREATMERRHGYAALVRARLREPHDGSDRVAAEELELLADELDDRLLTLDPACGVACMRLVSDPVESPLLNPSEPQEELRSRVRQIRSGFRPASAPGVRTGGSSRAPRARAR